MRRRMKERILSMAKEYFGEKISGITYKRREGVYAIILNSDGRIATVKTPRGYFLPGGGIEDGEDHEEALIREIKEEIGHESKVCDYIETYNQFLLGMSKPIYYELVGNYYECKIGEDLKCKTEEDHQLEWLEIERAISELQLEYQRYAVQAYLTRIN